MHHFIHLSGFGHQDGGLFLVVILVVVAVLIGRRAS
jgi:hypothetical protein